MATSHRGKKLAVVAGCGLSMFAYVSLVDVISPREKTVSAIVESFCRVQIYAKTNGTLPRTVADFPQRAGYANRTNDGWGNPLTYTVDNFGIVTLMSYGSDARRGGSGDAEDVGRSYRWLDDQGDFIAGDEMWIVTGEIREVD